jgi:hypothetical protein
MVRGSNSAEAREFFFSSPLQPAGSGARAASMGNGGAFAGTKWPGPVPRCLHHTAGYLHFSMCFHDVDV